MRIGKADGDYEDRDLGDLPYAHPTRQAESHSPRTKWNCRQGRQPLRDGQTDGEGAQTDGQADAAVSRLRRADDARLFPRSSCDAKGGAQPRRSERDSSVLAEIREDAAEEQIAAIYADIRAVIGVPMVNLIYRHIAVFPGALAWAWNALRPHVLSGALAVPVHRVLTEAQATPWPQPSRQNHLRDNASEEMSAVVDWYNRGNAMNLVTMLALRHARVLPLPASPPARPASARHPHATPLEPPLRLTDIADPLRARILDVSARQGLATAGVTPTMYLHLARWPQSLELALNGVEAAIETGDLERAVERIRAVAVPEAMTLASALRTSATPPSDEDRRRINDALDTFTSIAIPQMIAVGTHLRRSEMI